MPREKVDVDLAKLQDVIDELESQQTFKTRTELYQAVSATEWGQSVGLNQVIVYLRVRDNGLECKTPIRGHNGPEGETRPARRVKKAFIKFDVNAFLEPFVENGIEIEGIHSVIISSIHTPEMISRIRGAWNKLRERFGAPPIPENVVEAPPVAAPGLPPENTSPGIECTETSPAATH